MQILGRHTFLGFFAFFLNQFLTQFTALAPRRQPLVSVRNSQFPRKSVVKLGENSLKAKLGIKDWGN